VSLSLGAVASSFPPERRAKVISLLAAGWIVPGVAGPPYAALAAGLFGWRIALVLLMPVLVVARFVVARFVVAPPQAKAAPVPPLLLDRHALDKVAPKSVDVPDLFVEEHAAC